MRVGRPASAIPEMRLRGLIEATAAAIVATPDPQAARRQFEASLDRALAARTAPAPVSARNSAHPWTGRGPGRPRG